MRGKGSDHCRWAQLSVTYDKNEKTSVISIVPRLLLIYVRQDGINVKYTFYASGEQCSLRGGTLGKCPFSFPVSYLGLFFVCLFACRVTGHPSWPRAEGIPELSGLKTGKVPGKLG